MKLDLSGKSVLITGSSKGIGLAIAQAFHAEGCQVALNGRNQADLTTATDLLAGSIGALGDVTKPLEAKRVIQDVVRRFGKLDVLVCNVGSGRSAEPGSETAEEWHRIFALNLWSTTNTVEAAKDALVSTKGSIVCISSICGLEVIPGAPITYSAAKAALHAYVRGIARPLGLQGVRINAIAPGNILFDGSVWSRKLAEDKQTVESMLKKDTALGRFGTPVEVASLVTYLASQRSGFATGSVWTLDGGQIHS